MNSLQMSPQLGVPGAYTGGWPCRFDVIDITTKLYAGIFLGVEGGVIQGTAN